MNDQLELLKMLVKKIKEGKLVVTSTGFNVDSQHLHMPLEQTTWYITVLGVVPKKHRVKVKL